MRRLPQMPFFMASPRLRRKSWMQRRFPFHTSFMVLPVSSHPHDSPNLIPESRRQCVGVAAQTRGFGAAAAALSSVNGGRLGKYYARTTWRQKGHRADLHALRFSFSCGVARRETRVRVRLVAKRMGAENERAWGQ